jgi:hypothetical protein
VCAAVEEYLAALRDVGGYQLPRRRMRERVLRGSLPGLALALDAMIEARALADSWRNAAAWEPIEAVAEMLALDLRRLRITSYW